MTRDFDLGHVSRGMNGSRDQKSWLFTQLHSSVIHSGKNTGRIHTSTKVRRQNTVQAYSGILVIIKTESPMSCRISLHFLPDTMGRNLWPPLLLQLRLHYDGLKSPSKINISCFKLPLSQYFVTVRGKVTSPESVAEVREMCGKMGGKGCPLWKTTAACLQKVREKCLMEFCDKGVSQPVAAMRD